MPTKNEWFHIGQDELEYSKQAFEKIKEVSWAQPLVKEFNENGAFSKPEDNRPFFFEIRYAADLVARGVKAKKEVRGGVGKTNIDFEVVDGIKCLIELVAINESQMIKDPKITKTEVISPGIEMRMMEIRSDAPNQDHTEAKEMKTCQGKILAKVAKENGDPHKFSTPTDGTLHIILVDARGFCGGHAPDLLHLRQMTHGPYSMAEEDQWAIQFYGEDVIEGLFDPRHPDPKAKLLRERIHMIGFVNEKQFRPGCVLDQTMFFPNYNLPDWEKFGEIFPATLRRTPKVSAEQARGN